MLAFQLPRYEGPRALELTELPEPAPDPRRLLIDVRAVGVNFPDLLATRGEYQHRPALPFIPGCEIAGEVLAAPPDSRIEVGERIAAFTWDSGYAERVLADPAGVVPLPEGATYEDGAAMVVNYQTAYFALSRRGALRRGERVLVLGAAGGIGTAAVQIARGLGATVIAGVADPAQGEVARAAGAEEVLVLELPFADRVRELTGGRGVDIVLDPLGDRFFDDAIRALAPEGRVLVIGFAAGAIPQVRVNRLLHRNVSVAGVGWGAFLQVDPSLAAVSASTLNRLYEAGDLRPQIGMRVPFSELPTALEALGRGEIPGKAVAVIKP